MTVLMLIKVTNHQLQPRLSFERNGILPDYRLLVTVNNIQHATLTLNKLTGL